MNKLLNFIKGIIGILLFYGIQIGFQLIFYSILIKKNNIINNILFIIMFKLKY